jgi:formylglycine-generating enzyme required for sulfatase activity
MVMRLLFLLALIASTTSALPVSAQQRNDPPPPRYALLIGNANYPDASAPLTHPSRNVRALADELRRHGFDVDAKENLGKEDMQRAIDAFKQKIKAGSTALFFFSGYGLQVGRQSFIVPVNAQIWSEADIRRDGFSIESVLTEINSRGARVKLVILDASRRNPFERRFRGAAAGLAAIDAPEGTLIMSAAAPGKVINEAEGANSIFIGELVKELRSPGLTADEIFSRTRIGVSRVSNGEQVPYVASSLVEDFYFVQPSGRIAATPPAVETRPPPRAQPEARQPEARQPEARQPEARQPEARPPPRPAPPESRPAPTPPSQQQAAVPPRAESSRSGTKPGDVFRDCGDCPEMVVVPPGTFDMGSNVHPSEKPERRVTIAKPFAMGRREVTFDEWDQCVASGSCTYRPDDRGLGRGERPVINVSWHDAKAYVAWLAQKTGQKYRLPSEAEWEYAARGGTKTSYWWGTQAGARFANCRDCGGAPGGQTVASGTYAANPFGLFDTAGNAAEWVEDCWNDDYRGAPRDGSAWTAGQCRQRVLRGGSFDSAANLVRSASRWRYDVDVRYHANGFRVVREMP